MNINLKSIIKNFIHSENLLLVKIMFFSLLCFVILTTLVIFNIYQINYFDNAVVINFNHFALKNPSDPMIFITNLGSVKWILPVAFLLIFGFLKLKQFREAFFLFMITGGAGFLTVMLKWLIGRARPAVDFHLTHAYWFGFPSGHTALATCFYGALIYLAFIYIKNKWLKAFILTFLSILILLIGISRVYLGVHFSTDVLAGLCIGIFWTAFCVIIYKTTGNLQQE
ncbi:MAG: phosphatase PAP2 family protein [Candidatus Gastranaerophilales bacterium]|nr:phosphatase PAP2 family protein [Candidatus Gastranaerophilales bacterium]